MGRWRELFESSLVPPGEREYGEEYTFGPPATPEQLDAAEHAIGLQLPADVRGLLAEFNGVWYTTEVGRRLGYEPAIAFLDLQHMMVDVPDYFADDTGNPLPNAAELKQVVWVRQSNGLSVLWGVCLADVAGHQAGSVVKLECEIGRLQPCRPSLAAFVSDPDYWRSIR